MLSRFSYLFLPVKALHIVFSCLQTDLGVVRLRDALGEGVPERVATTDSSSHAETGRHCSSKVMKGARKRRKSGRRRITAEKILLLNEQEMLEGQANFLLKFSFCLADKWQNDSSH